MAHLSMHTFFLGRRMELFRKAALKKALQKKAQVKTHTVMLVDDEKHNLLTLSDLLSDTYNIITAADGQEGIELLQNHPNPECIHVIISDQRMPRLSGVEFLHQTLEINPKAKRILLTGFSDVDAIIDSINKGQIYKFILKPYEQIEMVTTVRRAIEVYDLETRNDRLVTELQDALDQQVALNKASTRFVPHDLLTILGKQSITEVELGDHTSTEMSVMFSDIRGFTGLSERMTPRQSFDYINAYLSRISPIIREHNGFIVKYMGDGIMAVFPNGSRDAVRAGNAKLRELRCFNQEIVADGHEPVRIGIGVNTGSMMLGVVGENNRIQGDVLSDAVNLTARIEGLTKRYGVQFIATEDVFRALDDSSVCMRRALGKVRVKGKQKAVSIYEVFDGDTEEQVELKRQSKEDFERGLELYYAGNFGEALPHFTQIAQHNPKDRAALYYQDRLAEMLSKGVLAEWEGIDVMNEK